MSRACFVPAEAKHALDSLIGACSCRRTGIHFAGTCAKHSGDSAMNRRAIVKGALGGILGLTLPPLARSAFSQEGPAVVPVSEGFAMLTGAGGNVLVRTASACQVLVDSRPDLLSDPARPRL